LKDSLVASFEIKEAALQEEIRKLDALRMSPGWNFCSFFLIKVIHTIVFLHFLLENQ